MVTEAQIGELMREIRKEKGFTSIEIANRLNISQPKLSRIETGTQPVTISLLSRFCDLCGISLSEFFRILEDKISFQTHIKENQGLLRRNSVHLPAVYRFDPGGKGSDHRSHSSLQKKRMNPPCRNGPEWRTAFPSPPFLGKIQLTGG